MNLFRRLLLLGTILSLGFCLSSAQPAQAGTTWTAGFYTGWVSFSAAINTDANWGGQGSSLDSFVIEKYEGRGQLLLKIDDQGKGGASIVLPVSINLLDYGKITLPNGTCTFSSSIIGASNYVHLRNAASDLNDSLQVQVNLTPGIRYKSTNAASFGELKGCDQAGTKNLGAMKIAMNATTSQIQSLQFTVKYNTGSSAGGTCTIPGWVKTTAIPNASGQGVRSLGQCNWRVFKAGQPNQQQGWK